MTLLGIDHVQLAMPRGGEPNALAFYAGILGLEELRESSEVAFRGGCWFACGRSKVHLGVDPNFSPARKAHPAFIVRDLPTLCTKLVANGFPVRDDEPLSGYLRVYTADPFGNRIELIQPIKRTDE